VIVAAVAVALFACPATGQGAPAHGTTRNPREAQPERPTVATHAGTVAEGYAECEAGIERDRGPDDARGSAMSLVTKVGVGRRTQLSVFLNGVSPLDGGTQLGDAAVGVKWRFAEDHPVFGDVALLPVVKLPTGSESRGAGTGTTDASLWLISSRDLGPVHLDANVAYTRRSGAARDAAQDQWLWTASFSGAVSGPVGWTAEWYGYPGLAKSPTTSGFLYGLSWTLRPDMVVDAGAIAPVAGGQPRALFAGVTTNVGRWY
jgi:hypothetical protein